MRKILTGLTIVASLAFVAAAAAQGTGSSGTPAGVSQGNGATGAGSGGTSGAAPVGHRQPHVGDVPEDKDDLKRPDPRDAALDRALHSICRGC